jgi:putative oxygen-independent coproporphyrinogen III oxidase
MTGADTPGIGVYIHWPFCASKCPYCDFNSHVRHQPIDEGRFLAAYRTQIAYFADLMPGRSIASVFFGGGTPSLMQPETVAGILTALGQHWVLPEDAEITLEANPSSVEAERFAGYRDAGVNRLSLGVQALNDNDLAKLGRLHDTASAIRAIELARRTFERLSFDLIYARPGQTLTDWLQELDRAIDLAADHMSLYQLTIEPGTPFFDLHARGKLIVPDTDLAAQLYERTVERCAARGLEPYEVSNHARPGAQCQHNLVYWRYGEYVGIGPGAHGRIVVNGTRLATACGRHPETWLEQIEADGEGLSVRDALSSEEAGDELLLMGLRLREGVDLARFEQLSGRRIDSARLAHLVDHALVEELPDGHVRATLSGWMVLNAVVADLAA